MYIIKRMNVVPKYGPLERKPGMFDYEKYEKMNKCNNQKSVVDNITGPEKNL